MASNKLFHGHSHFSNLCSSFSLNPKLSLSSQSRIGISIPHCLSSLSYGPSLSKGSSPKTPRLRDPEIAEIEADLLDEDEFAREFDIAAIRVPSEDCFALERRLRGHLLNWPRVRNIARVSGDDFDDESIAKLVGIGEKDEEERGFASVRRRIDRRSEEDDGGDELGFLSSVLAREEAARKFGSRGFVRFRNLARLSRPRKRKKREREGFERARKRDFVAVEVFEDDDEEEGEDWKGLLGEKFEGVKRWRGPTRLLLLDERCSTKCLNELPEAIKAVLRENTAHKLVNCKLTLFYEYWPMNEILEALLPSGTIIPSSFETVGHIAHLNLRDEHSPYKKLIAKVVLDKNKPKIQTVVNKIDSIHNDYRTMQLEVLSGNHSLVTTVIENGLRFSVDLALVYWNSRLATERQRLLSGFTHKDVICDVFCGVGPIAISAARIVKRVYANDLNPHAIEYLERNSVRNKLEKKVKVFNMDGRRFIIAMLQSEKASSITQFIMNLPNDAVEFLDAFKGVLRGIAGEREFPLPTIHVYGFSKARDPEFDFHERIRIALTEAAIDVEMRKVRLVAPGKWMLCATFVLPKSVAFANSYAKNVSRYS